MDRSKKEIESKDSEMENLKSHKKNIIIYNEKVKDLETNILMLENVVKSCDLEILNLKHELESRIELEENVIILENALECRDQKVNYLEEELKKKEKETSLSYSDDNLPSTSKCGNCEDTTSKVKQYKCVECDFLNASEVSLDLRMTEEHGFDCEMCDFRTTSEENMKNHRTDKHAVRCNFCGETFIGTNKLKNHMCKIKISNPEYWDLYMKDWYIRKSCIPIFSRPTF